MLITTCLASIVTPEHGLDFPMNIKSKNLFSKTNKRSCSRVPVVAALTGGFSGPNHVLSAAGKGSCPADSIVSRCLSKPGAEGYYTRNVLVSTGLVRLPHSRIVRVVRRQVDCTCTNDCGRFVFSEAVVAHAVAFSANYRDLGHVFGMK